MPLKNTTRGKSKLSTNGKAVSGGFLSYGGDVDRFLSWQRCVSWEK